MILAAAAAAAAALGFEISYPFNQMLICIKDSEIETITMSVFVFSFFSPLVLENREPGVDRYLVGFRINEKVIKP